MNDSKLKTYTTRITQANKSELLSITYELYFEYTKDARACHKNEDMVNFEEYCEQAQKFVLELMQTLNYSYPISKDLFVLYVFVNKMLIQAILKHKVEPLDDADMVMNKIKTGYDKIKIKDTSKKLMQNTETIYAGLTYGRGNLSEMCDDANIASRGYRA